MDVSFYHFLLSEVLQFIKKRNESSLILYLINTI